MIFIFYFFNINIIANMQSKKVIFNKKSQLTLINIISIKYPFKELSLL